MTEAAPSPQTPAAPVVPAWERRGRVFVIGVDGLTLDVIGPMVAREELPAFARLAREGAHGPLETIWPTNSPLLWTTIATGRHHRDHGIDGFQYYTLFGRPLSRSTIRERRSFGFRAMIELARLTGLRKRYHFDGTDVRARRFWDLAGEMGWKTVLVNWWLTWPAAPMDGLVVSDRAHYWRAALRGKAPMQGRLTYPEELLDGIRPLMLSPDDVAADDVARFVNLPVDEIRRRIVSGYSHRDPLTEARFLISADRTYARAFHYCLDALPDARLAVAYFRGPDIAQHCAFGCMPSSTASRATEEQRRIFGGFVPEAYRLADEILGGILERLGRDDTVLVLSDHGYGRQEGGRRYGAYGHHEGRPPGVLYARGPEFRPGAAIGEATVYDLMPTLLRLMGLPPASDMEGKCLEGALTEEFRAAHPPLPPVGTYGASGARQERVAVSPEVNKEVTDHLRALGYLD